MGDPEGSQRTFLDQRPDVERAESADLFVQGGHIKHSHVRPEQSKHARLGRKRLGLSDLASRLPYQGMRQPGPEHGPEVEVLLERVGFPAQPEKKRQQGFYRLQGVLG